MNQIERELVETTKVSKQEGEETASYLKKLAEAGNALSDELWGKLSSETQDWVDAGMAAIEAKQAVPDFNGKDQSVTTLSTEEKPKPKPKAAAKPKVAKPNGKAPAKKAAAPKKAKEKSARGRKGVFADDAKVTSVAKECPFREGSKAAKCFAQYKVGKTVSAILSAGVPRPKLYRHMKRGVVKIG